MKASNPAADLVFHALAFVPISELASPAARAASLEWPAYAAFAQANMPSDAWRPFVEDAALLSRLFEPMPVAHGIGWLAELFDSLSALERAAACSLVDLDIASVSSSDALRALASLASEPVEILRADLALAAPAFERGHASLLAPFLESFLVALNARLDIVSSSMRRELFDDVVASVTLGPRGRGFPSRTYVGTTSLPGVVDLDVDSALVLALHEAAVKHAARALSDLGHASTWSEAEPIALELGLGWARGTPLEAAYRRWSSSLDRSGLAAVPEAFLTSVLATELDVPSNR